jgi:ribosomal protein S18 acetylase RimI-like enzyme
MQAPPGTVLRRASVADAQALATFAESSFRDTFAAENKPDDMDQYCRKAFGPDIQERELRDREVITVLALCDGHIVGYSQLRLRSSVSGIAGSDAAEIQRLYVGSAWQGKRLAHELLRRIVEAASLEGAEWVWLGVWERNARAIRFYTKVGFAVVGEHDFALGGDMQRDLIMRRRTTGAGDA